MTVLADVGMPTGKVSHIKWFSFRPVSY